jgi:hypothetical protein
MKNMFIAQKKAVFYKELLVKADLGLDDQIAQKIISELPAIYLTGFNRITILNLIVLLLRPFMSGGLDSWCVLATARKV